MQSIWKGAVTFGLVHVPVKLYSATENHDVSMHQVHDADGGRIKYQRVCDIDGEVIPFQNIERAFDEGKRTVILSKTDLAGLPAEKSREIEVVEFVPTEQIDPIMYDKAYYLEPDAKSPKAYVLLRETLRETERTAVVKFALRERTQLAILRVVGDVLVLQTLLWGDEVRKPVFPALESDVTVSDKEVAMAKQLVTAFESDFEPDQYTDDYQVQLRELIDAKLAKGDSVSSAETFGEAGASDDDDADIIDLMAALRKSVEAAKAKKGGGAASDDEAADDDEEGAAVAVEVPAPKKRAPRKKAS
jgi:DNA end-binding protein Ku